MDDKNILQPKKEISSYLGRAEGQSEDVEGEAGGVEKIS